MTRNIRNADQYKGPVLPQSQLTKKHFTNMNQNEIKVIKTQSYQSFLNNPRRPPVMQVVKSKVSSDDMDEGVENIIDESINERTSDISPTYKLKINSIFEKRNQNHSAERQNSHKKTLAQENNTFQIRTPL